MPTQFQNHCLASPIEEIGNIEKLFNAVHVMKTDELIIRVKRLCRSHERLRAELQGAEQIIATMDRKQQHGCTDASCEVCDK